MKIQNKNISFKHPEQQRFVRGTKLGHDYEKEVLEDGFSRQIESSKKRGITDISSATRERESGSYAINQGVAEELGGQSKADGSSEGLCQRSDGQASFNKGDDRSGVRTGQRNEQNRATGNDFDIEKARAALAGEQRSLAEGFGRWQDRNESKQQRDTSATPKHSERSQSTHERDQETYAARNQSHEPKRAKQFKRTLSQQQSYDLER